VTTLERFLTPQRDFFSRAVGASVLLHILLVLCFLVKSVFFKGEPLIYENAIKVDLVALPDKLPPQEAPAPATPEAAAPVVSEPAKPTPPIPPTPKVQEKPKVKEPDMVSLEKASKKEKAAMKKLREMEALSKIKSEIETETRMKTEAKLFKGNQLSSGSELTGLSKLNHDNYIAGVKKHIYDNWSLPEWLSQKELSAQVLARFDEKGNLIFKQIVKSSGNPSYDENIMEALEKSSPVPMPPEQLAKIISGEGILIGFPE
jgi:colicin import membrane protein